MTETLCVEGKHLLTIAIANAKDKDGKLIATAG